MIWIAKRFDKYANWAADQDTVGKLQMAVAASGGEYSKVLMALVPQDENTETVYIGLPSLELSTPFVGYEIITLPGKPVASLLLGDQNEFEKHFRFPVTGA